MALITPFKGLRYDTKFAGPMTSLVAPPYDVVNQKYRDKLVSKNPYNVFSLELTEARACVPEKIDKYHCAGKLLSNWMRSGILKRDPEPAIYPYEIDFSVNSAWFRRKGFIALVRIEEWKDRIILPHERTFDKVTRDRYRLLEATQAQFSQIFMLYRHNDQAAEALEDLDGQELYAVEDDIGNTHRLFRVTGPESIKSLTHSLEKACLYIADGHHRYTTALRYRNAMRKLYGDDPSLPFNFLMTYLVDSEDQGLIVLPTHRILKLPNQALSPGSMEKLAEFFDIERLDTDNIGPDSLLARLEARFEGSPDRQGIGVIWQGGEQAQIWWCNEALRKRLRGKGVPRPLDELDVVALDDIIIRQLLGLDPDRLENGRDIRYTADGNEALKNLMEDEILFFLRPTPVEQVLDTADAGLTMPHKSTFFYPKILTGLVMNSLHMEK